MYVIGVLLTYNNAYNESTDILRKEVFWKPEHQELYNVVKSLYDEGETVDPEIPVMPEAVNCDFAQPISACRARRSS